MNQNKKLAGQLSVQHTFMCSTFHVLYHVYYAYKVTKASTSTGLGFKHKRQATASVKV